MKHNITEEQKNKDARCVSIGNQKAAAKPENQKKKSTAAPPAKKVHIGVV